MSGLVIERRRTSPSTSRRLQTRHPVTGSIDIGGAAERCGFHVGLDLGPCPRTQSISRRASACADVSTPVAIASSPVVSASSSTADTRPATRASSLTPAISDGATFTTSTGRRRRYPSDANPRPKLSTARRTPIARRCSISSTTTSKSRMRGLSWTSSISAGDGTAAAWSRRAIRSATPRRSRHDGETSTATTEVSPNSARIAATRQIARSRPASSAAGVPLSSTPHRAPEARSTMR